VKTLSELRAWHDGAALQYGDPAIPVGQIFAQYARDLRDYGDTIVARWNETALLLKVDRAGDIALPIDSEGPRASEETGELEAFGLNQIAPGFWALSPSLNLPGVLHCFVLIFDVPVPAPWERRIITPAEYRQATSAWR
jgi:hypothetical protein